MKSIKKTVLFIFLTLSLGAGSTLAFAEQTASSPASSINETIAHIKQAIVEINKSDFAAANVHLIAARASSKKITGDETMIKKARAILIQGQIQSKQGEINKATTLLNQGLELYRSLQAGSQNQ